MFDIGFWELALLGVIGLIVLGPERLPVVARTLGRWVGKARQYVDTLTTELENEVDAGGLRDDVRRAREKIESETREFRSSAERAMEPLMEPIEGEARDKAHPADDDDQVEPEEQPEQSTQDAAETPADDATPLDSRTVDEDGKDRP